MADIIVFLTAMIFFVATGKAVITSRVHRIPLFEFVNPQNMVVWVLHTLYGMFYWVILTVAIYFIRNSISKKFSEWFPTICSTWIVFAWALYAIFLTRTCYRWARDNDKLRYEMSLLLCFLLYTFGGIASLALFKSISPSLSKADIRLYEVATVIIFLYFFTKIMSMSEIQNAIRVAKNPNVKTIIKFKKTDGKDRTVFESSETRYILSKMVDFVVVIDETVNSNDRLTFYPTSEIEQIVLPCFPKSTDSPKKRKPKNTNNSEGHK